MSRPKVCVLCGKPIPRSLKEDTCSAQCKKKAMITVRKLARWW